MAFFRNIGVHILRGGLNALYRAFSLRGRRDEALFLSRQSNEVSQDYALLENEFEARGFQPVVLVGMLTRDSMVEYAKKTVREVWHLAHCRVCFVDGYDPVVGLLRFKCEGLSPEDENTSFNDDVPVHDQFPVNPIVIQLWHAFGAYKNFGYQSIDTREGRTTDIASRMNMHGNYSWIICTGDAARAPFAEAFHYPESRVMPLGRPMQDELVRMAKEALETPAELDRKISIVFAPTLRRNPESDHPFKRLYLSDDWRTLEEIADVAWSFHPVERTFDDKGEGLPIINRERVMAADLVITDYSSIAYEMALMGKRVVFYMPDIDEYLESPGLNVNPLQVCPGISFTDCKELLLFIVDLALGEVEYPDEEFDRFLDGAFVNLEGSATRSIANFAFAKIRESLDKQGA